jgi:hypothetical protein
MSEKFLTAEQERELRKGANSALRKIHSKHAGRSRGSITEVENENYQVQKSDCEQAISGLHRRHDSGRTIAKRVEPGNNAGAAISALHSDRSLAGRTIEGPTLVAKLASAIGIAIKKDYASAAEAKREIKKLLA